MRFTAFDPAPGFAGCGVLTARGDGVESLLDPEVDRTPLPDSLRIDLEAVCALPSSQFRRLDEYGAIGVAAARQALRATGVPRAETPGAGVPGAEVPGPEAAGTGAAEHGWGVMIGSSTACGASNARHHRALRDRAKAEPNASDFVRTVANAVNGDISIALRCTGPAQTFVSGWTAGAEAIIAAGAELAAGRARRVLAGGIESGLAAKPAACGAMLLMGSDGPATGPGALRLSAFWRGHDPDGRWSPAGALDALHPRRITQILVANTIPADRLARWRAEAGEAEILDLTRRIGEPGAAGAAVAAAMASRLDGSSLVIALDPAGGIAALAFVR